MKILSTLVFVCASVCASAQSNYLTTGKGAGDWNDPMTWQLAPGSVADDDGNGVPDSNDNVTIQSGHSVVVKQLQACKNLDLNSQEDIAEIIVDAAGTLNVSQQLKISSPIKDSEVYVGVMGNMSAGSSDIESYGQDYSVEISITGSGSFAVAGKEVKSVAQLTGSK